MQKNKFASEHHNAFLLDNITKKKMPFAKKNNFTSLASNHTSGLIDSPHL